MEKYSSPMGDSSSDDTAYHANHGGGMKGNEAWGFDAFSIEEGALPRGMHEFMGYPSVFWTDANIDAVTVEGRKSIALQLNVSLANLVSFTAAKHTNEIVVVDDPRGIYVADEVQDTNSKEFLPAGWSEPILPPEHDPSLGAERGTYDGIVLVGRKNFEGKYLLATGADCTPVGARGRLKNGEEFIAIAHGGRKGTMTGIMENLAKRLRWLGVDTGTVDVFIGPAAQSIEVPVSVLEDEGGDDNSWRRASVSDPYMKEAAQRVLYNNQGDSARRVLEHLGIEASRVHIIDEDTVDEKNTGKLHSFRRDKTKKRNCLIIGFA